jgi:hypothetical protein
MTRSESRKDALHRRLGVYQRGDTPTERGRFDPLCVITWTAIAAMTVVELAWAAWLVMAW